MSAMKKVNDMPMRDYSLDSLNEFLNIENTMGESQLANMTSSNLVKVEEIDEDFHDNQGSSSKLEFKRKAKRGITKGSGNLRSKPYGEPSSKLKKISKNNARDQKNTPKYEYDEKDLDLILKYSTENMNSMNEKDEPPSMNMDDPMSQVHRIGYENKKSRNNMEQSEENFGSEYKQSKNPYEYTLGQGLEADREYQQLIKNTIHAGEKSNLHSLHHHPQIMDRDTEAFKNRLETLLNNFKLETMTEFMEAKRSLLQEQEDVVEGQKASFTSRLQAKELEVGSFFELV